MSASRHLFKRTPPLPPTYLDNAETPIVANRFSGIPQTFQNTDSTRAAMPHLRFHSRASSGQKKKKKNYGTSATKRRADKRGSAHIGDKVRDTREQRPGVATLDNNVVYFTTRVTLVTGNWRRRRSKWLRKQAALRKRQVLCMRRQENRSLDF